MTTPVPHPERRSSSYPEHYRDTDTDVGAAPGPARRDGAPDPLLFTVPASGRGEHAGHQQPHPEPVGGHGGHGGHGLMMLVCCVPMVAVVVLLVVSGTAGAGALVWALGCVLMMAAMMTFVMPGGHGHK